MNNNLDMSVGEYYASHVFSRGTLFDISDEALLVRDDYAGLTKEELEEKISEGDPTMSYIIKDKAVYISEQGRVVIRLICKFQTVVDKEKGRIYEV